MQTNKDILFNLEQISARYKFSDGFYMVNDPDNEESEFTFTKAFVQNIIDVINTMEANFQTLELRLRDEP